MSHWIAGARPRTLGAAAAAVVVGTAAGATEGTVVWWRALLALVVAVGIQIGTNYANDYSDGKRGADAKRSGPVRLVASGLASPTAVKRAAIVSFAIAAAAGAVLAIIVNPLLFLFGGACILAGWFYTGGPRPYGYMGLGELFVFIFFGVAAVCGTAYVVTSRLDLVALLASLPVGLLATALLVVNNLRDIDTDASSGKRTLAVMLGERLTRSFYVGCVIAAFLLVIPLWPYRHWALLSLLALVVAIVPLRQVAKAFDGIDGRNRELIKALGATGALQMAFALLLAVGLVI
ncbi:MAG: 1,4-dihydroxy-2-naphthoate polyprenyltransferase [Actinobacteria bacterium]|nr:1,4-dihydroxy-2-naphthoate polyprenyltransferase [Actinomycetota bacterium]MCL6094467.1 1,4-dihydroxy-2-naphthoate polyprenyltransferase [Actinomycetota bacterium]